MSMLTPENTLSHFQELNAVLLDQLHLNKVIAPHFVTKFYEYSQLPNNYLFNVIKDDNSGFNKSLLEWKDRGELPDVRKIPAKTHRVWLTSQQNPALFPEEYLEDFVACIRTLPDDTEHYFWTNSDVIRNYIFEKTVNVGRTVILADVEFLNADPLYDFLTTLIADHKFVLACDILKIMVMIKFGGLYGDLGVTYNANFFGLVRYCKNAFFYGGSGFLQSGFIASEPNSPILQVFAMICRNPNLLSNAYALVGPEPTAVDELNIFSGIGLSIAYLLTAEQRSDVMIIPPQSRFLQCRSEQSWYGEAPKYGNVLIKSSDPSVITAKYLSSKTVARKIMLSGDSSFEREKSIIRFFSQLEDINSTN